MIGQRVGVLRMEHGTHRRRGMTLGRSIAVAEQATTLGRKTAVAEQALGGKETRQTFVRTPKPSGEPQSRNVSGRSRKVKNT